MKSNVSCILREGKETIRFRENKLNEFILDLIKVRTSLLRMGKGRADMSLINDLGHIRKNILAYPMRSETGQAKFFIRNLERFKNLLPGKSSPSHQKMSERFDDMEVNCRYLLLDASPDYTALEEYA